jgi:hypothetical protein
MSDQTLDLPFGIRKEIPAIRSSTDAGGIVSFVIRDGKLLAVPADDSWFWTSEWQERNEQALLDLESGRFYEFDNGDDFIDSLSELIDE